MNITLGCYKMRNGMAATVQRADSVPCTIADTGKPDVIRQFFGTDENGQQHIWGADDHLIPCPRSRRTHPHDLVECL